MKLNIFSVAAFSASVLLLTACYEDKGNYNYSDLEEVTVDFPESIVAMEKSEPLTFSPKVTSSIAGDLTSDNADYEFGCQLYRQATVDGKTVYWHDINPDKTKDINILMPSVPAGNYTIWYTVTNKKSGVTFNFKNTVSIRSTTSEGWMVLSRNGADKKARLDMIYTHANGQEMVRTDVFPETAPEILNPTGITMCPVYAYSTGDEIYLTAEKGAYKLNVSTLAPAATELIRNLLFISPNIPGDVVNFHAVYNSGGYKSVTTTCVTSEGNCYGVYSNSAGACFEFPMNSDGYSNDPTYKVAPFIGSSQTRPGNSGKALFYDTTNKRFMIFNYYQAFYSGAVGKILIEPQQPENPKFSFVTGMDIVDMESTRYSDGEVFSVLQDAAGHRHVYGIMVNTYSASNVLEQGEKYSDINAENFDVADDYAFHSQYPFMFYCKGNKVYCYDLGKKALSSTITLDGSEKVSKLKFNLYQCASPSVLLNQSDEFFAMQFKLIVASSTGAENGGAVRFYDISTDGKMTLNKEFKGFGEEIVDVTYREQHK